MLDLTGKMSAEGRNLRRLTRTRAFESAPAWSPDGRKIAFSSTRGGGETSLYVMNADGSKVERLEAGAEAQSPTWSPDGKEIAYAASFEGHLEIHVITLKNGKVRRLTEGMHAISPAWSPDGSRIAFIAYVHGSPELYLMNDKGKKLQRLTTDSAADADPAWSPDGERILFTSDRGGVAWLYTIRTDGSSLKRLPLSNKIAGAYQADWSRGGRIIFSFWTQTPAKMSAEGPAPATLVYSPTPTPTEPAVSVMSVPEAVTGYNRTISYAYDSLYRLTGAVYSEGATVSEYAYGYDLRGNRTSVTAPGVGTFSYSYNLANQITFEDDFTYDLNGNLTGDGYATYTYDAANRLRGVGTTTTYQYDGVGNRIGLTHNNVETAYLLDPSGALSQVLRESTGGVDTLYLYGLDIIGQQQGSVWTTLGYDPLGSVRFVLDSTGTLTHALNYDPYGVPLQPNTTNTTLGFTGEQTDPNNLLYLRARYYDPKLGAFTSVDPVLGVGGSTGWNGYLYANANPANLTDPSGACIGPLTFLLPVCIGAGKLLAAGLATATIVGGAAFVNDVRGQVWYNQTQAGLSFIDSFQHLNVGGLIDSTVKGAEFGFNLGTGFGAGALAQKFGFAGAKAIAAGLASDVILGASWDIAAHGDNFFAAVAGNTLGFLGGELAGNLLQRGVKQVARSIGGIHLPTGRFAECSFDADTLITTEDGEEPISELKLGERVLAYNEATEETGYYPISAVLKHTDPVIVHLTIDGETIDTTPEHPFYTEERGWVAAGKLTIGDRVRKADGTHSTVQAIQKEKRSEIMYNLTVEKVHTFFVGEGQWLVHNECFDIALGVGEYVPEFAQSFNNPPAYFWRDWPDDLIRLPDVPKGKPGKIMMLANRTYLRSYMPIILDRVRDGEIPNTTIRFNLQGLTDSARGSITMLELGHILKDSTLRSMTVFYEGIGIELAGDQLRNRLLGLGFRLP